MQFEHDKHQYFFEKYLRGEMAPDEKVAFEQKLQDNENLNTSFNFYVNNRQQIITNELNDYNQSTLIPPKRPQNLGWLYMGISILGIVLVVDYYLNNKYNESVHNNKRKTLIERINIFKAEPTPTTVKEKQNKNAEEKVYKEVPNKQQEDNISEYDSTELFDLANQQLEEIKSITPEAQLETDELISDTILTVFTEKRFEEKLASLTINTDSILPDSTLFILTAKSLTRKPDKTDKFIFVEFWHSPVNFKGYRFSGKKLLLYGMQNFVSIYFTYNVLTNTHYLIINNNKYILFADNNYHKLKLD